MIEEMTGPGGWGVLDLVTGARPVVAADIGYGDNALFRQQLTDAGWQYAVAVKGSTSAHDGDAVPQARPYGGLGQPPKAAYPDPPATLRQLALAAADQVRPGDLAAGHQDQQGQPRRRHDQLLPGHPGPARQPPHPPAGRPQPARPAGCWPNGRPRLTSPPATGCPPCRRTPPSTSWSAWPRSDGGSSTTTAS